ncbi:MAG TPA: DUF6263 family protein [Tenuifilaceae bacterium]|nr:DUF6263 family protein [Tenuifilaceae bacterium]HPE18797.1 DUF6263 family protein [Tenuifilaceae bacterium]HPQ34376.1 DUF6263 family protein [Tenuifilaceae bacterium]
MVKAILLLYFCSLITVSSFAGNDILLRLKLNKGDVTKYRSENSQVITQTVQGMNQVVDQSQIVEYTIHVADSDGDGNVLVDIVYNRIVVEITANGMEMKFDSDSNNESANQNPQFMGFAALVGKSLRANISPLGEVLEVTGVEEMLEKMLTQIAGDNAGMKAQLKTMLDSNFSEDAVKQMFSGSFIEFPEGSIKENKSWSNNHSIKNQFTLKVMNNYTLKGIDEKIASIDYTSTLNTIPGDKTMMQGMEMVFNLMGTQSGNIKVDVYTGKIVETTQKQNITGNVAADMGGQTMNIPMTISSQSKTSVME